MCEAARVLKYCRATEKKEIFYENGAGARTSVKVTNF
jgi:hypothetical protein